MSRKLTLKQIIEEHPRGLAVGAYHRGYQWEYDRADGKRLPAMLAADIADACERGEKLFMHGITLSGDNVVDGVQRLTMLGVMLDGAAGAEIMPAAEADRTRTEIDAVLAARAISREDIAGFLLDNTVFMVTEIDNPDNEVAMYKLINGMKTPMPACDIIKADLLRTASDPAQPNMSAAELTDLRSRYTHSWNSWVRWWRRADVAEYYDGCGEGSVELLLRLCLRGKNDDLSQPVTHDDFKAMISRNQRRQPYNTAKRLFLKLRRTQNRFEDAFADTTAYNRIRAVLLLFDKTSRLEFLKAYFEDATIDADALERIYRLAFLGMTYADIQRDELTGGCISAARFDDMLAALSMPDVYHTEAKRDAFLLLLRLNIDEDIKLGRRFDFTAWHNRSLEHIYSKSKVWHTDDSGRIFDGNDNDLRTTRAKIERDKSFLNRADIVNNDGTPLSEHCIGNLVLLYGSNNAEFGNTAFNRKKTMFLTPGDLAVFRSRNLLHSVCVFATDNWTARSIVDNYNLTLKNLKIYYGFK